MLLSGQDRTHSNPSSRLDDGIGLLSENRKEEGLMLNRSLADNLTATNYAPVATAGFVSGRRQRKTAQAWLEKLQVRARDAAQPIAELSGGNQQKIAIGRLLHHDARIFLLDEPTRGIDVGAKSEIYTIMQNLARDGVCVIMVSSELPEVMGIADRIAVMRQGRIAAIVDRAEATEEKLLKLALPLETTGAKAV